MDGAPTAQAGSNQGAGHQDEGRIGFLSLLPTRTKDGFLGALLVTNNQGIPLEFRCTHPVKPTTVQRSLYGETLEPHIGVTLCGVPLLMALQQPPSLVLVRAEYLLEVRKAVRCPTLLAKRVGEAIEVNSSDSNASEVGEVRLAHSNGKFQTIICQSHSKYRGDVAAAKPILESLFEFVDPIEPFERVGKALEVLASQDKRFQ